jgi:hypothetical protein
LVSESGVLGALADPLGGHRVLVVERVVEKIVSAGPANYPTLTKTNYNQWALLMMIKLEMRIKLGVRGLWGAVDTGNIDFQVDCMALDAICSVVPVEMITALMMKDTVMEVWKSIKTMRIGDDRIRMTSAPKVRREYEALKFHDGEGIEDFTMPLFGVVNQLVVLGDPKPDDKVVRIAHPRFKQLVISIETLLSLEEVRVHLGL